MQAKIDNSKHTNGPWQRETKVRKIISEGVPVAAPDGSGIAWVLGGNSDECKANAQLISIAPDLLSALQQAEAQLTEDFEEMTSINNNQTIIDNIDAVLSSVRTLLRRVEVIT